ncbi:hypothetical protein [Sporosarcina sp. BP05]|uniref:hypothetical protein n=1 Tax=Sporosarcina sp. BP05 TaxID=2758726 RepID=UPI001649531D|nr:hypothetical protein [Sporosarcina sp. BP05]
MEELLKQFMEQMDKRFDQMESRFDQVDKRFDKVEQDIRSLTEEVRLNQTKNRSHFKHVESQLEQQQHTFQVVGDEIKGDKIDIQYLNQKISKLDMEINNLIQRFHS